VDEVLYEVLAEHVDRYLDAVEQLAIQPTVSLRRMAAAWRTLLGGHRPTGHGGCTGCGRGRLPGEGCAPDRSGDRESWCDVWRVASDYFIYRLPFGEK
jgi:hypothetical protein